MLKEESSKGVDPESGNEIPFGATAEEVRDDVDAKLSVGEFVLPADVVRYIGLNNLMKLRDAAKAGLGRMEMQGQMGNGDEQVVEGHNIDMDEMIKGMAVKQEEDETVQAFAAGGQVMRSSQFTPTMNRAPRAAQPIEAASAQYIRPTVGDTSAMRSSQYTPVLKPATPTTPAQVVPAATGAPSAVTDQPIEATPDFALPNIAGDEITEVVYVGPNGEEVTIRFKGTVPLDPIPVGYLRKDAVKPEIKKPAIEAPKIETPTLDPTKQTPTTSSSSSDSSTTTPTERKTDTTFALAEILAKDDPKMAEALQKYKDEYGDLDFSRMSAGDAIKDVFNRMGLLGIVKTVADIAQISGAKKDLFSMIPEDMINYDPTKGNLNTISADLLSDWNTSSRDSISLMETAKAALDAGASTNLALAIAIDDRFDSDVLTNMGSTGLTEWEKTVASMYKDAKVGSYVHSVIAKEDLDLFDGDLDAYLEFMGKEPEGLSQASLDQIEERSALQEQMDKLDLGDIKGMTAEEVKTTIAAEEKRIAEAEEKRIAEAEEKRKKEEEAKRKKEEEAKRKKEEEARAARTNLTQDYNGGWESSGGYTSTTTGGVTTTAGRASSSGTNTSSTVSGGSGRTDSGFGWAKGGMVPRRVKEIQAQEKKKKRKTSL